jgi:beta-N-acetylhexosaminidase
MQRAWASGLTAVGTAQAPLLTDAIRVIAQAEVVSDGVSEAGLPFAQIRALFEGFGDVEFMPVPDLRALDTATLPADGRTNILVSNHHGRYAAPANTWPVDLHLAVWNPFQVFDIAAPAVITWGYADGALVALRAWLLGQAGTPGVAPVALTTA